MKDTTGGNETIKDAVIQIECIHVNKSKQLEALMSTHTHIHVYIYVYMYMYMWVVIDTLSLCTHCMSVLSSVTAVHNTMYIHAHIHVYTFYARMACTLHTHCAYTCIDVRL